MKMKILGPFENPDSLWKWIKRECDEGNVKSVSDEPIIAEVALGEEGESLKQVVGRIVTIELGTSK